MVIKDSLYGRNRELVLDIRQKLPNLPAIRIAEMLSISRERVRQILKTEGLPTSIPRHYGWCEVCGGPMPPTRKTYCSAKCRHDAVRVTFSCDYCGESKTVLQCFYNAQKRRGYKNMYCSIGCRDNGTWNVYHRGND